MREKFRGKSFKADSLKRIGRCNEVIVEYQAQDLRLTLRQLYYQLVTKNEIPNSEKSYKNLGALVSDARLAGLMDWDAIEDRGREADVRSEWDSVEGVAESAARAFRLPRWEGQSKYAELWVEKQALAGVLEPLAREFHVTLAVNKGYSSQSAMYAASKRFIEAGNEGRDCVLLYLGDHDPSGEDMVRDIGDRLAMFEAAVRVRKVALTMAQIRQHRPPPNPAKMTDSRAAAYVAAHGAQSWEVDALPPNVLSQLIRSEFTRLIDRGLMDAVIAREDEQRAALRKAATRIAKRSS